MAVAGVGAGAGSRREPQASFGLRGEAKQHEKAASGSVSRK